MKLGNLTVPTLIKIRDLLFCVTSQPKQSLPLSLVLFEQFYSCKLRARFANDHFCICLRVAGRNTYCMHKEVNEISILKSS